MLNYPVHACTDVTGFGLLGHLREMSKASGCDVRVVFDDLPFIRETKNFAAAGLIPGGTFNNLEYVKNDIDFGNHGRTNQLLLADAQTSGGLLVAMPEQDALNYMKELNEKGNLDVAIIGAFTKIGFGKICVI